MSYVYILENGAGVFYIGYTRNLEQRVADHLAGKGNWTSSRGPWRLRYYEEYDDDRQARQREVKLKGARNRKYITWICVHGPGHSVG